MKIKEYVEKIIWNIPVEKWLVIDKINLKTALEIKSKLGFDLLDYERIIDVSSVKHVLNNHSNPISEAKRGQVAISSDDFDLIKIITSQFDTIEKGKNKQGNDVIIYSKKIKNNYFYVEEIRTGRKKVSLNTLYIKKGSK